MFHNRCQLIAASRRPFVAAGGGAAALALDGSAAGNQPGGTTVTATLTTTTANDIIVACFLRNASAVVSVADVAGLTWNVISSLTDFSVYYAKSSSILSSDVITVTVSSVDFVTLHVFAIKGANFTTPLDANGALPATASTGNLSLTTSTADGFLFGGYRFANTSNPTAGAGWTTIKGQDYMLTEYKIVSATQSGTTVPIGTGDTDQNRGIGHSVRA